MRLRLLVVVVTLTLMRVSAYSQQVIVDWAAKKVTSQPTTVETPTKASMLINFINDMMFSYSISYQLKPAPISDFDAIAKAFGIAGKAAGESATSECDFSDVTDTLKALSDAETAFRNTPSTSQGCSVSKPCNVTLAQAQEDWKSVSPKVGAAQQAIANFTKSCSQDTYATAIKMASDSIDETLAVVNGPHSVLKPAAIELSPDYVTSLEIDQLWNGLPTTDGTYSVDLQPANRRLTLSAGALFSEVQNRSYSVITVPNTAGTGTSNVLSIDGISKVNPTAIALLNYEIPHLDWDTMGLALSTGPVFRLGSKSDTSSFGYFAGVSVHLYHRFYITPGLHLGEFADFPPGFSQVNQAVPSGLATPTPTKRWTVRFGFAFSYKAKDFSQFGLSGSVTPTTENQSTDNGKPK